MNYYHMSRQLITQSLDMVLTDNRLLTNCLEIYTADEIKINYLITFYIIY